MADIVIQGIILAAIFVSILGLASDSLAVLFILIAQFFLGIYQLGSGIVGAVKSRRWKAIYLGIAFAYLIVGGFSVAFIEEARWGSDLQFVLMIILGMVIPILIGLVYFILSIRELNHPESFQPIVHSRKQGDDDILDDLLNE